MPTGSQSTLQNSRISNYLYKYQASGFYMLGTEKYAIDYSNFRSIVIDHQYDDNNMPVVYTILNLSSKLIDTIIHNKDTGIFILTIQKCVDNGDMPDLWMDYISDSFLYFTTEDINKTDTRDYENSNTGREDIYKELTVGLLSQNLVNNNKKTVNGILNSNSMASAIYYSVGTNRQLVLEPLENNIALKNVVVPPLNSVAKCIAYLNAIKVFYNTSYRYYMDFDVSYLLSSRGNPVPRKDDLVNTVMLLLRNDYDSASKIQGMTLDMDNQYYKIEVAATSVEVADYRDSSKRYAQVRYVDTSGNSSTFKTEDKTTSSNFANKTVNARVPNDNIGLVTNPEKTSDIFISINKNDLDASVFTPNKEYQINADEVYRDCDYSGKYLLRRKRELYFKSTGETGSDDKMTLSTLLYFEKVYEG